MTDRTDTATQDVFDIANWLERASTHRDVAPTPEEYVPRHRADVAADSVA